MRRLLLTLLMTIALACNAETPVKFMGIPVRGTVSEVSRQLGRKGFDRLEGNWFQGYFGGELVLATVLSVENRAVAISVGYLCESENDVVDRYNKLYSKIIMKDKYYYANGRKITMSDLANMSSFFDDKLRTVFYQMSYKSEKFENCKCRQVVLNVNRPANGDGYWYVTLTYANMEEFDNDY